MLDKPSLPQRIALAERAIEQSDQRLHELAQEFKPSAKRALHAHGKTVALSAIAVVVAGVLIYPRRSAIMSHQLARTAWAMFKTMGMPWLMQKAAAHAAIDEHEAKQEEQGVATPAVVPAAVH